MTSAESDYLLRLATLSLSFVGFSAVVVTLRGALGGELSDRHLRLVQHPELGVPVVVVPMVVPVVVAADRSKEGIADIQAELYGNPGPAAYGALLKDADTGEELAEDGSTIGARSVILATGGAAWVTQRLRPIPGRIVRAPMSYRPLETPQSWLGRVLAKLTVAPFEVLGFL